MQEISYRFVAIKDHVNGAPKDSDFEIKKEKISECPTMAVIVKNLYVSVDPYQINRMKSCSASQAAISFAAAVSPGQVYRTYTQHTAPVQSWRNN